MGYFQISDPTRSSFIPGYTANAGAEIKTGLLVKSDTSNKLTLAGTADKPDGFAFTNRVMTPTLLRTSEYADADEDVTIVNGKVQVWVDSYFFYNDTLPSVGDTIYTYTGGLMRPGTGSVKIGKCTASNTYRNAPNTTSNIVRLDLEIGGYFTV